jgi:hypothetical protein
MNSSTRPRLAQRKAAVETHVPDPELVQLARHELGHPLPAGENEGLSPALDELGEELAQLLELGGEVRLLVEDPSGVAEHAHAVQADHDALVIDHREDLLLQDAGDLLAVAFVGIELLRRHSDVEVVLDAPRQLRSTSSLRRRKRRGARRRRTSSSRW